MHYLFTFRSRNPNMEGVDEKNYAISPRIVQRAGGGWLAFTPPRHELVVGVTADTEDGARVKFQATVAEWRLILESDRGRPCQT